MKTAAQKLREYTQLIKGGNNVKIDPPGVINAEGGGATGDYLDKSNPTGTGTLTMRNNGSDTMALNGAGDLTLAGTVYINGDTDVQDLTPIFTVDIVSGAGAFTTSTTWAEVTDALETGHRVVLTDGVNVYTHTETEYDGTDISMLYFTSVTPSEVLTAGWSETEKVLSTSFEFSGGSDVVVLSGALSETVPAAIEAFNAGKLVCITIPSATFRDPYAGSRTTIYNVFGYVEGLNTSTTIKVVGTYSANNRYWCGVLTCTDTEARIYVCTELRTTGTPHPYIQYTDGNTNIAYDSGSIISAASTIQLLTVNPAPMLKYIENGNTHILPLAGVGGTAGSYGATITYRGVDPYSSNTLLVYTVIITYVSASSYTVTATTDTYTIS